MPRMQYTGVTEAGVAGFSGYWQPNEARDVTEDEAAVLRRNVWFVENDAAPVAAPTAGTPVDAAVPHEGVD